MATVRTFDREWPKDPGEKRRPTGREGFVRDLMDLRLCFQAQESAGRGSVEAGVATHVHVGIGDMHRERREEFHGREIQGLSFARANLNRGFRVGELRERDRRTKRIRQATGELLSIGSGEGIRVMNVKAGIMEWTRPFLRGGFK